MGFWDFFKSREVVVKYVPYGMGETYSGDVNSEVISTVYTCIKVLSETLSKLPLEVYIETENGKEKFYEHPLYDILKYSPNGWMTSQAFKSALETNRNSKGNTFAKINRDDTMRVISIDLLEPIGKNLSTLEPLVTGYQITNGQLYYVLKGGEVIHSHDLLHFKGISKDGIWGMSPIEALRYNLNITGKALRTQDSVYTNQAMTQRVIKSTIGTQNSKGMQELVNKWNEENSGSLNAGKMSVLPPNTEIQELGLNLQDAEFINTINFNADEIYKVFGVPKIDGDSKFSNIEQLLLNFKANTMSGILSHYRQELELKLLSFEERKSGVSIEFNDKAMLETDFLTRIKAQKELWSVGVATSNDIARQEGYRTFKGGDKHMYAANNFTAYEDSEKPQENE